VPTTAGHRCQPGTARQTTRVTFYPARGDLAVRVGARRPSAVPAEVLQALKAGRPSVNHMEQMALDQAALLKSIVPAAGARAPELRDARFLHRLRAGARIVWETYGEDLFDVAAGWESDTARGWAAFAVPLAGGGLSRQLSLSLKFADDDHFAVREWAWLGARPLVHSQLTAALDLLHVHTRDPSPRVRRFCSEVTRPRGVWSGHIDQLKSAPEMAFPLLDALVPAPERYVADSIGNWLNDASRTAPGWVIATCQGWRSKYPGSVEYVCRRGLRSLKRGGADSANSDF
jgi:3-methyladenine DNA glycosylase AlkC